MAALAFFLTISGYWISGISDDVYQERATSQAYAEAQQKFRNECAVLPTIKKVIDCFDDAVQEARETERNEEDVGAQKEMAKAAWAMFFSTLAIGLLSLALTVVGIGYVRGNLKEMQLARDISEKTLSAANRSAASASEANWATQAAAEQNHANAERQLRAYICVETAEIDFDKAPQPTISLSFKNFGQTPAHGVESWTHTWLEAYPLQVQLPEPDSDLVKGRMYLGPNASFGDSFKHPGPITGSNRDEILAGTAAFYVYGAITYVDVFFALRETRFRLFFMGGECRGTYSLMPHSGGNEGT